MAVSSNKTCTCLEHCKFFYGAFTPGVGATYRSCFSLDTQSSSKDISLEHFVFLTA